MQKHLDDILFILGAALITIGTGLIYIPAAFIAAGVFCLAYSVIYGQYLAASTTPAAPLSEDNQQ